jgi:hypothetical protein
MVIESWRNGTANQRIRIIVVKICCKPRTLVGERKSLCSNLADITVLALLIIFFFGFLAFDYELLESKTELTTMRWDAGQI